MTDDRTRDPDRREPAAREAPATSRTEPPTSDAGDQTSTAREAPATSRTEPPSSDAGDQTSTDIDHAAAEEMAREMAAVQARIAKMPAATIVANHAMGLYELGAIHLNQQPPNFADASLAIDALAALVDRLAGRLGGEEETLRQLVSGLRMAFVQLRDRESQA